MDLIQQVLAFETGHRFVLDLTGLSEEPSQIGQRIRATAQRWTGLPVCVGIGPTKTLAKLANRLAKQEPGWMGVADLGAWPEPELDRRLAELPSAAIWGIGARLAARLEALGLRTALDLKRADPRLIRRRFSVVLERTVLELRGLSCLDLEDISPAKRQIQSARSFGTPVTELGELAEAVTTYIGRAAEKLRAQSSEAGAVNVMLRTNLFRADESQYSASKTLVLAEPSADTRRLAKAALHGLRKLYRPGYRYAKAGIMLLDLVPASARQADLWSDPERVEQGQRLMGVMDRINRDYGRDTIRLAGAGLDPRWAMRQANRSPRYTTRWDELPTARC